MMHDFRKSFSGWERRALCALLASGLLTCAACKPAAAPKAKGGDKEYVAPVRAALAVSKSVPVQIRTFGRVEAFATVAVKTQVAGELQQVLFKEGDFVTKGQTLLTIDPRPFEAALKQSEANLARDEATARNAEAEAKRFADLVRDGAGTQQQADNTRASADAAAAAVRADKAMVETARLNLAYCTITSPLDGRTGRLLMDRGNIVKANDLPVVTITQVSPISVSFSVPERDLARIRARVAEQKELQVFAGVPNDPNPPSTGVLSFMDNMVDPATGTIKLKATFENADRRLWPGQLVNVAMNLAVLPDAVVVPTAAIETSQESPYVFVIKDDMTAEMRTVTPGVVTDDDTVVEKGLSAGERIVTDGQMRVTPGAKVQIVGEGQPNAARVAQ